MIFFHFGSTIIESFVPVHILMVIPDWHTFALKRCCVSTTDEIVGWGWENWVSGKGGGVVVCRLVFQGLVA